MAGTSSSPRTIARPVARVTGFEVSCSPAVASPPISPSARRERSHLTALLLSSSAASSTPCFDEEVDSQSECFSDDEELENGISIPMRDEGFYKAMLRARAIVNYRLWNSDSEAASRPAEQQQHQAPLQPRARAARQQ